MRHLFILKEESLNNNLEEILKNEIETLVSNKFNPEVISDYNFNIESNSIKISKNKEDIPMDEIDSYSFRNYFQLTSRKEYNFSNFINNVPKENTIYVLVNYTIKK